MESEVEKIKPFKLCFKETQVVGRSNIRINRPVTIGPIVTAKFYSKYEMNAVENQTQLKNYMKKLKSRGPREKYEKPVTENQCYGWYQIEFTDKNRIDQILNYHKNTDILIKEHLMNYERIRNF